MYTSVPNRRMSILKHPHLKANQFAGNSNKVELNNEAVPLTACIYKLGFADYYGGNNH